MAELDGERELWASTRAPGEHQGGGGANGGDTGRSMVLVDTAGIGADYRNHRRRIRTFEATQLALDAPTAASSRDSWTMAF